jgi:2-oxo-4-hydroxy-4-carboxy-5-ureidoimidazoline decarboxylase
MELAEFNAMTEADASATVSVWAAIPWWVAAVVESRPYTSVDDLTGTAAALATRWTRDDLDQALAHHPRIGERPAAPGAEAEASAREQASMSTAADDVASRIAAGNAAYEAGFGRVFLIRAAGRSPEEMLAELERRLGNDDDTEAGEALEQLAQIALLRLSGAVAADERRPS